MNYTTNIPLFFDITPIFTTFANQYIDSVMTISRTILLSSLMVLMTLTAYGRDADNTPDEVPDSSIVELHEVVVRPEKVKVFADHDEMTLGPENREFGANAIDAISSLPLFRTRVSATELTNLKGETVNVVIDGRFASAEQLATYRGQEIKSVSYYPFTPSRYQAWCNGPLIEVRTMRPRNAYVSMKALGNAMGEVTESCPVDPVSSSMNATLTYMDSLNMLKADYRFGYLNKHNMAREIEQGAQGTYRRYRTDRGHEQSIRHNVTLNYQYDRGGNTFSAIAGYTRVPRYRLDMPMEITGSGGSEEGTRETHSSQNQEALSTSLFYDRSFRDRSALTVSAQGSLTWTTLSESLEIGGSSSERFSRNTDVNSRVLRCLLDASYSRPLGKGELTLSAFTMADAIHQSYLGERMPDADNAHITARASYKVSPGRFSFDMSASYVLADNSLGENKRMAVSRPTGSIRMGWRISRLMSLRLSSSAGLSYSTPGLDYENKYYDGENYYQQGNFDVRPTTNTYHSVNFSYTDSEGKIAGGLSASLQYDVNPFFQYIIEKDDDYVRTTLNSKNYLNFSTGLYGSFRPTDWLTAYVNTSFRRYNSPTPGWAHAKFHNRVYASLQVTATYRNLYISADARNGGREYRGDERTVTPFTSSVQVAWQHRNLLASLTWAYNLGRQTTVMESGDFMWSEFAPPYRPNVLSLTLVYTFSHGIYRQKNAKGIMVGTSSGLGRGNL